ncbi:hypothetical protein AVEN_214266-1 [Araneus ventricosus]|uniref:Uncharacterized protein n=1 Tax=Araneus ventricosus TaxID=182803 RepID=A0A4Y2FBC1_ARAVE|nr:hypothetical protein AVEN_140001-1 [Araneus ventricosus]GBM37679.1 hypothetical protein AVEN_214266-1 [Araneus ventricosus]
MLMHRNRNVVESQQENYRHLKQDIHEGSVAVHLERIVPIFSPSILIGQSWRPRANDATGRFNPLGLLCLPAFKASASCIHSGYAGNLQAIKRKPVKARQIKAVRKRFLNPPALTVPNSIKKI